MNPIQAIVQALMARRGPQPQALRGINPVPYPSPSPLANAPVVGGTRG